MLFDSSVLIAHLRGDPRATDLLLSVPSAERRVSVLSRVELEGGMRTAEKANVSALFAVLRLVPVTDMIAGRAGEYLRTYRRSHSSIDLVDYVIAASAEIHGARLQTLNVRHFPMFKDMKPAFGA